MHVTAAVLSTLLVVLLVFVQPFRGRRRYLALVEQVRTDPSARGRYYLRGVVSQWILVWVIAVIGLLAGRSPTSVGLTAHHATSAGARLALVYAGATVVLVAVSVFVIRRSGPTVLAALRRQARPFVELLPRSTQERQLFVGVAVTAGICEEIIFRGFGIAYVRWLVPGAGTLAIVLVIGAAFGVAHLYQGRRNVVTTGILGGLLAWLTIVTGTLLPAMAIHTAIDLRVVFLPESLTEPFDDATPPVVRRSPLPTGWLQCAAGVVVVLGATLPWLVATTLSGTSVTHNAFQLGGTIGIGNDGVQLVIFGTALAVLGLAAARGVARPRTDRLLGVVSAAFVCLVVLNRWSGIHAVTQQHTLSGVSVSIGIGYWIVAVSGVASLIASIVVAVQGRRVPVALSVDPTS